jgi:hypothetical protein
LLEDVPELGGSHVAIKEMAIPSPGQDLVEALALENVLAGLPVIDQGHGTILSLIGLLFLEPIPIELQGSAVFRNGSDDLFACPIRDVGLDFHRDLDLCPVQ